MRRMTMMLALIASVLISASDAYAADTTPCYGCKLVERGRCGVINIDSIYPEERYRSFALNTASCVRLYGTDVGNTGCGVVYFTGQECAHYNDPTNPGAGWYYTYETYEECEFYGDRCNTGTDDGNNDGSSPIIISEAGHFVLTSASNGVRFDLDADGVEEQTAWTASGSGLKFLALDVNGNGKIDNGRELFGNYTFKNVAHGFQALGAYDANDFGDGPVGDGAIDFLDSVWDDLLLWEDANHDGVSQPQELFSVADSGLKYLAVNPVTESRRMDKYGNTFRFQSMLEWQDGRRFPYYDVFFQTKVD